MEFIFITLIFSVGCCTGSFINVLESRLSRDEDILRLPSHCDFCKKRLRWFDLVPIFSWIFYRGKSRCCHKKLSLQHPLIELATGIGFVTIFIFSNLTIQQFSNFNLLPLTFYLLLFTISFAIFLQDIKYQAIHSGLLYVLIGITCVFLILNNGTTFDFQSGLKIFRHVLVAVISALPFFLLYRISHEKWLGEGDVWLAAWIGLFLGFPQAFTALYWGIVIGGVVSLLVLILKLKKMRDTISLGPFLLMGVLVALFM